MKSIRLAWMLFLFVLQKNTVIKSGPEAGSLSAGLERSVRPTITGIEQACTAGGLVEGIWIPVVGIGLNIDEMPVLIFLKTVAYKVD